VGGTPDYTVSVMYYNPKEATDVGGHGGGIPAQMFHDTMAPILEGTPNVPFAPADPAVQAGTRGGGYSAPAPESSSSNGGGGGGTTTPAPAPTPTAPTEQTPVVPPAPPATPGAP